MGNYKEVEMGKHDLYDDFGAVVLNPPVYYVPVGDNLYRPTNDRKEFCKHAVADMWEAWKDDAFGTNHDIACGLKTLLALGYQQYDLCLLMKISYADFTRMLDGFEAPYLKKAYDSCFSSNCSWHPIQIAAEEERKKELARIFGESSDTIREKYGKFDHNGRKDKKESHAGEDSESFVQKKMKEQKNPSAQSEYPNNRWMRKHGFNGRSSFIHSVDLPYGTTDIDWNKVSDRIPLIARIDSGHHQKVRYRVNLGGFIAWMKRYHKGLTFHTWEELKDFLTENHIPITCFCAACNMKTLYGQGRISRGIQAQFNVALGYTFIE